MLEQVRLHIRSGFPVEVGVHSGTFTIEGGVITLPFLLTNQYFRIVGSVFNDGLHQYPAIDLTDETFTGSVWALAVPKAVIDLADEIQKWQEKNADALSSPYSSESFGGYSYSKTTDAETGGAITWKSAFKQQLGACRKI